MTKTLFFALLLLVQTVFSQNIYKDPAFASNGVYSLDNSINYSWAITQDSAGRIYSSYSVLSTNQSFVFRLTPQGNLDSTFGNNGIVQLPYYTLQNQLKIQSDGKVVILGYSGTNARVTRLLSNGQLDTSFATNGSSMVPGIVNSDTDSRSFGLILQNEKIIVHGISSYTQHRICRFNNDGSVDMTFGNYGSLITQGAFPLGTFVLLDQQNNITCLTGTGSTGGIYNGIIEKYNSNGQPITSFGNNGILELSYNLWEVGDAIIDSNNKIVYSNKNLEIFRLNPDGTPDNTFQYDLSTYSGLNGGAWIRSIVEKNGNYYIGGNGEGDFASTYFISKLNQNGSVNSAFGYYSESSNLLSIKQMFINPSNIIVYGGGNIVKYIANNGLLSTTEIPKANPTISFENPVKQHLIYSTKETVQSIEVYSSDGKLKKIIQHNNSNTADLPTGVYIIKVIFANGKETIKKLIKN